MSGRDTRRCSGWEGTQIARIRVLPVVEAMADGRFRPQIYLLFSVSLAATSINAATKKAAAVGRSVRKSMARCRAFPALGEEGAALAAQQCRRVKRAFEHAVPGRSGIVLPRQECFSLSLRHCSLTMILMDQAVLQRRTRRFFLFLALTTRGGITRPDEEAY